MNKLKVKQILKKLLKAFYLPYIYLFCISLYAETILTVNFNDHSDGQYTKEMLNSDWQTPSWNNGVDDGRAAIVSDPSYNQKSLEILYPALGVGPSMGGAQWQFKYDDYEEVYASYYIYFPKGWDGVKGGKLPGLCGEDCPTGGDDVTGYNGFSARYMFRPNMKLVIYCYHMDKPGTWGEDFELDHTFEREVWYKLTQRIKMNTPGVKDGEIQVWVDDLEALNIDTLRFRAVDTVKIDKFYFSTFYGGSSPDWAPLTDQHIYFDEFEIYTESNAIKNKNADLHYLINEVKVVRSASGRICLAIPPIINGSFKLFDLNGRVVNIQCLKSEKSDIYTIRNVSNGIYILSLRTLKGHIQRKLSIVN
jgi:hypothetical protein